MSEIHKVKREYAGRNETRTITPTCSCGWRGSGVPAWNDQQHFMVALEEAAHLQKRRTEDGNG